MPLADINGNHWFARVPENGGDNLSNNQNNQNNCNCGCQEENKYPQGYWMPGCFPPGCPPPSYPEYPYCPPVNTGVNSTEAQIAKLAKKSSIIRKMISINLFVQNTFQSVKLTLWISFKVSKIILSIKYIIHNFNINFINYGG